MARIRSIKPEFPQSETIGRLSRDARLLFIQLWTVVDDAGRARAASRMLASLLYPYDDDAAALINDWLFELEREGCIRRYEADGAKYLDIPNWLKHQKIDRPSASKIPEFREPSTDPREPSRALAPDLGSRTLDLGSSEPNGSGAKEAPAADPRTRLFEEGLTKLATITGRGPDACRSLLGKWLKATQDEAIDVLAAIEDAERERVANPVPWINQRLTATAGRLERPAAKPVPGFVIRFDSPQARAWERHNGKSFAWGQRLQRTVPTEWPPGHGPPSQEATVSAVADPQSQMSRVSS